MSILGSCIVSYFKFITTHIHTHTHTHTPREGFFTPKQNNQSTAPINTLFLMTVAKEASHLACRHIYQPPHLRPRGLPPSLPFLSGTSRLSVSLGLLWLSENRALLFLALLSPIILLTPIQLNHFIEDKKQALQPGCF